MKGNEVLAKTEIVQAKIYRNSAVLNRCGEVALEAGVNTIYVEGLNGSVDEGSYKLKFPEMIKALNIQLVSRSAAGLEEDGEKKELQAQIDEIDYRIETCNMMMELRKTNSDFSARAEISVEAQEKYLEELPEKLMALHKEIDELQEKKEKLEKDMEKLASKESQKLVMAQIETAQACTVPFELQYREMSAGWVPKYEVHYANDKEPLRVEMKAMIRQDSGENWQNVSVTLYTGNPARSQGIPELQINQLLLTDPAAPVRSSGKSAARECEDGAAPMMMMAAAAGSQAQAMNSMNMLGMGMMAALKTQEATVSEEETMTAYVLPVKRDVIAGSEPNVADLKSFSVQAKYQVLCIPRMNNTSFLTADIESAEWPLPPAKASIYLQETFVGEVYVNPVSDTDTFMLSLGEDERISVIRTEQPEKTGNVFMKNVRRRSCESNIRVVNKASETLKVMIKDQIPVSTDKLITVDVSEISKGVLDEETGYITWELDAEPQKKVELTLAYSISWPKDRTLQSYKRNSNPNGPVRCRCGTMFTSQFCPECGSPR